MLFDTAWINMYWAPGMVLEIKPLILHNFETTWTTTRFSSRRYLQGVITKTPWSPNIAWLEMFYLRLSSQNRNVNQALLSFNARRVSNDLYRNYIASAYEHMDNRDHFYQRTLLHFPKKSERHTKILLPRESWIRSWDLIRSRKIASTLETSSKLLSSMKIKSAVYGLSLSRY